MIAEWNHDFDDSSKEKRAFNFVAYLLYLLTVIFISDLMLLAQKKEQSPQLNHN
jgi:hypothetical protein